jgi:hypothetical protein
MVLEPFKLSLTQLRILASTSIFFKSSFNYSIALLVSSKALPKDSIPSVFPSISFCNASSVLEIVLLTSSISSSILITSFFNYAIDSVSLLKLLIK